MAVSGKGMTRTMSNKHISLNNVQLFPEWDGDSSWKGEVTIMNLTHFDFMGIDLLSQIPFGALLFPGNKFSAELRWDEDFDYWEIDVGGKPLGYRMDDTYFDMGSAMGHAGLLKAKEGAIRVWSLNKWVYKFIDENFPSCTTDMVPSMTKHEWMSYCSMCKASSNHAASHHLSLCYECASK